MPEKILIPDLEKLLQPNFDVTIQVIDYTTKRFTAAGDNYGSFIVRCDVKYKKEKCDKVQKLQFVVKMSPPNEWLRVMFKTHVTFRKEIGLYTETFPALREFQKKQVNTELLACFPKCYGARLASNNPTYSDSVILLENLKNEGFSSFDRLVDFGLEEAKLVMKNLAVFHAVPIAMKMLEPETFRKKVLPYLDYVMVFDDISEESARQIVSFVTDAAAANKECVPFLPAIEKNLSTGVQNIIANKAPPPSEPFATVIHNDLWITNTMIRYEKGKPVENRLIDFQLTAYGSPGNDIVFFLFSSVQKDVLEEHYDSLVKMYHATFLDTLTRLKCDTAPFGYEKLLKEIATAAKTTQFHHVLSMMQYILPKKGCVKDIFELSEKSVFHDIQMSDEYMERVPEKILSFAKRGWI